MNHDLRDIIEYSVYERIYLAVRKTAFEVVYEAAKLSVVNAVGKSLAAPASGNTARQSIWSSVNSHLREKLK